MFELPMSDGRYFGVAVSIVKFCSEIEGGIGHVEKGVRTGSIEISVIAVCCWRVVDRNTG
jgi:hypothetical protein